MKKLLLSVLIFVLALIFAGCGEEEKAAGSKEEAVVNIGSQKAVTPYYLAKEKKWFEEEFAKQNVKVNWVEVPGGAPQFEALAAGRIDFFVTGNTPPISGQEAGIPFKVIGVASTGQKNIGIVVKKDSNITSIVELKGKKIAVAKSTAAYDNLIRLLNTQNLTIDDVEIINLQANEAKAAYIGGSVDAWVVTEPFLSQTIVEDESTVIADGSTINYVSPAYYIGREQTLKENPEYGVAFLKVIGNATNWQSNNLDEAVSIYSKQLELSKDVVKLVIEHVNFTLEPINSEIQKNQQSVAKFLFDEKAIDSEPNTEEVTDNQYVEKALKELESE